MNSVNALVNIAEDLKREIADREAHLEWLTVTFMPEGPKRERWIDLYGSELMSLVFILTKLRIALEKVKKELDEIKV